MNISTEIQELIDDVEGDFPSASSYARIYRHFGMQVVPAYFHNEPRKEGTTWKRPKLATWKQYQKTLMTDDEFDKLYGSSGEFVRRSNMGMFTQVDPKRIIILDLDTYKTPQCIDWWHRIHAEHNMGIITETVCQKSGGGGEQHFFIAPEGWSCPTNKNPTLGIDSRGFGGFTMLPPSLHESGNHYEWLDGYAPWEIEFAVMPDWMCDEVEAILGPGASHGGSGERVKTSTPNHQTDAWGHIQDGREDKMTRMVFRAVLEMYRDCPIIPSETEQHDAMKRCFEEYVDVVESRIHEPGTDKHVLLNREGRGIDLFKHKWQSAIKQWDDKISTEAARPFVKEQQPKIDPFSEPPPHQYKQEEAKEEKKEEFSQESEKSSESDFEFEGKKKKLLKLYTIDEIKSFGPVKSLVQDTIAEGSLGFIYGQPGCGKTFVALSLGLSIAYGFENWFWNKKIERSGPVIYISLEGKADLGNRLTAWQKHHNIPDDNGRFRAIVDEVNFLSDESIKLFVDSIDDYVTSAAPPAMIFIDTVSRAIAGGAENDQQEMSKFIQTCDRIKNRYTSNVTGIHHSGRFGNHMRGSTTFDGGADFMFRVSRTREDGLNGMIHAEKIKAYADKWEMPFRLAKIDLDAFGAQSSLVAITDPNPAQEASSADFGGKQETATEPDMETCRKMVLAIHQAYVEDAAWSKEKTAERAASKRLSQRFGFSVEICQKYVDKWFDNDVIMNDKWGEKKNKNGLRILKGL